MVVVLIEGVVKLLPVPITVPPVAVLYQLSVPELAVAPRVTVPESQTCDGIVDVILGVRFTVAKTAVRVDVQVPSVLST